MPKEKAMHPIEFRNFTCCYKHKKDYITALEDLSFSVEAGELFVILGPSGCGKTTLLKSILGLCDYISGQLFIDGIAIDDFKPQNSNIGFVRQEPDLYPHMTVYENIAFPLRTIHTPQEQVDRRVKEMAQLVGLELLLTRKPRQLSGGQLQRVALARALVKNPVLLLLDEPFSNIDPQFRTELRLLVKKVHQLYGCTMLLVTHDIADAYALADRILLLDAGRVQALDTPQALTEKGFLV